MSHCLILGMTESGKSTLARALARKYKENDVCTLVLDPLNDPRWQADFQSTDAEEFLRVFWSSRRCAVFIDESGDMVGKYNTVMQRTATRGRHWGHAVHFITQRGVQLATTVRDQCSHIFLFTNSADDGKTHANEWNQPKLRYCSTLKQGNFFHCTRYGSIEYGSLWGNAHGTYTDNGNGRRDVRRREQEDSSHTTPQESLDSGDPTTEPTSGAETGDPADDGGEPSGSAV